MSSDRPKRELTTTDHSRDAAQLEYVYPVVSRRARGVSVGINLNPNHACNWACVYCQVPDLVRGAAPPIDLERLSAELQGFLREARTERWLRDHAPEGSRQLRDIAFSGNGEPTTVRDFDGVCERVLEIRARLGLDLKTVLITNGSQMHKPHVLGGVRRIEGARGEVWFKLDRATAEGRQEVNGTTEPLERVAANLAACAEACPTLIQTCAFAQDGAAPAGREIEAYLDFLRVQLAAGVPLRGVLLYGLARPSLQPGAERLSRLGPDWMSEFADRIRAATGLDVTAHP